MSRTKLNDPKVLASLSAGLAAGLAPQFSQAALVTVGGDTLSLGNSTNFGGVLAGSLTFTSYVSGPYVFYDLGALGNASFRFGNAVRSSSSNAGSVGADSAWNFASFSSSTWHQKSNARFDSDDNWVPGHFKVDGVNSNDLIYGWLQVGLNGDGDFHVVPTEVTILSFTYNDQATGTESFLKPVGGFEVGGSPVSEPGTLGLAALALGAAGVTRRRRHLKARAA